MRACAAMNAICAGVALLVGTFAACAGGSAPVPEPSGMPETSKPLTSRVEPVEQGLATDPRASEANLPPPPAPVPKKEPVDVADCRELLSEITNDPPTLGVVMNNATTSADAGASDRFQPIMEQMKVKNDGFRCCFDLWGRNNVGAAGRIAFKVELDPAGKLITAKIKHEASDIHAPEVESCMVELVKSMTFPRSPSGKGTKYTHLFEFKVGH